jgi:ribosomal protein L40E
MKLIGIIILVAGLILGAHALTMDVGIDVPARDFGYGVSTPAMKVANVDLMTQRQNYLIFSGILAVVGAILTGFASMQPNGSRNLDPGFSNFTQSTSATPLLDEALAYQAAKESGSVSICPKCRSMGPGDLVNCGRCGATLGAGET